MPILNVPTTLVETAFLQKAPTSYVPPLHAKQSVKGEITIQVHPRCMAKKKSSSQFC